MIVTVTVGCVFHSKPIPAPSKSERERKPRRRFLLRKGKDFFAPFATLNKRASIGQTEPSIRHDDIIAHNARFVKQNATFSEFFGHFSDDFYKLQIPKRVSRCGRSLQVFEFQCIFSKHSAFRANSCPRKHTPYRNIRRSRRCV